MKISPITYSQRIPMKAGVQAEQKQPLKKDYPFKYSPALVGTLNGICWAGIGFAFDQGYKALFKTKGNLKTSIILNGLIGLGMGAYAYHQAKKLEKSGEVKNWADTAKFNNKKS